MGREVRRVPIEFDWPLKMIWKGYHNPYQGLKCKACDGSGLSPEYKKLSDDWYGFERPENQWCHAITQDEVQALVEGNRLWDFTRVPLSDEQREVVKEKMANGGNSWLPYDNGYIPTAEEVNEWSREGFGHDAINRSICVKARAQRLGIQETTCKYCQGDGAVWPDDKFQKLQEEFEWTEPPEGEGWQMWETTSEGSPISPVFKTPEELAQWLADNNASSFGRNTASFEQWYKMITGTGWAMSAVVDSKGLRSGVEAVADR